jgi:transcriptional regulator with XRE-family HTH domain
MKLHEKIKSMRKFKDWSQEFMAEQLEIAHSSYAKIEQGKTDVSYSRLQQIAHVFKIELADLIGVNEKNVFHITGNSHNYSSSNFYNHDTKSKIEKMQIVINNQKDKIELLQQRIQDLESMIKLLKN